MSERSTLPDFIRRRIEREIESALHPTGMSVHDGRGRFYASDIQRLLVLIDRQQAEDVALSDTI